MALTCPADLSGVDYGFDEFIDCSTLSINYDMLGMATVSFTVVASHAQPNDPSAYTSLVFGEVRFTGFVSSLEIRRSPGTLVYEHRYSIAAIGCRA